MDNDLDELTSLLESDAFSEEVSGKPLSVSPLIKSQNQNKYDNKERSEIHNGDTDSSDDEDNKYTAEQNYTETGRSIKNTLKKSTSSTNFYSQKSSWKTKPNPTSSFQSPLAETKDVYSDPFFGIRIVTPLISSQTFKERMDRKIAVSFNKLEKHLQNQDKTADWVIAGVIVSKYIKTSQKGNQFVCWTISDLREGLKTVSVFLFGKAYKDLWKTSTHVVVAILNPNPLDNRKGSGDIAALSVLNTDQVMVWGQSKDLGVCRSKKKNGEPCTSFVNKHQCEYCIYHVKQEYKKFTGRSELQASGGGSLNQLRNKVLGKNEVFYGGKSFTAVVAKPSKKQATKDKTRLSQLFNMCETRLGLEGNGATKLPTQRAESNRMRLLKDAQRLQALTGSPSTPSSLALGPDEKSTSDSFLESKSLKRISIHTSAKLEDSKVGSLNTCSKPPSLNTNLRSKLEEAVKHSQKKQKHGEGALSNTPSSISKKAIISNNTPSNKCKMRPTKNRFENLSKLKSKLSEIDMFCDKSKSGSSKSSSNTIEKDSFDISFEFDDSEDNLLSSKLDEVENTLKNNTPKTGFGIEKSRANCVENKPKDKIISEPLLERKLGDNCNKALANNCLNNNKLKDKIITGPLHERKSPNKYESALNTGYETVKRDLQKSLQSVPSVDSNFSENNKLLKNNGQNLTLGNTPKLSEFKSLSLSVPTRQSRAKVTALKYIKRNGPITKEDPTKTKLASVDRKRKQRESEATPKEDNTVMSKRFLELMNTTSKHLDLISNAENEAMDEYYEKMEKKEKMEEKMLNTFKVECKAFKCLKCKYKWFSPSELCKAEKHPIKMVSAVKRFFECQNCKNRTVSLEVIPLHNCSNCGRGNWLRAAMMRERKPTMAHLSIRGGEQKFTNSVVTDTNLDLLVPD